MATNPLLSGLTKLGVMTGHPAAFLILIGYTVSWALFEPDTLDMHGWATLATWLMTLFIQRATHRDTQALQAKTDELLRALSGARTEFTRLDEKQAEEIEEHRARERDGLADPL